MASLDVSLRRRVVIENVLPSVDDGRFPIARTVGERVIVRADVFADGHDSLAAVLLHRPDGSRSWQETAMVPLGNDRWQASFVVEQLGDLRVHGRRLDRSLHDLAHGAREEGRRGSIGHERAARGR